MYKIIYMKADYEPWWQFEGWEEYIVQEKTYTLEESFNQAVIETLQEFREKYDHEKSKEDRFFAFWSECENEYCEACDTDAQIYHGIIIEKST